MCSELIIGGNSQLGIGLASHFDASGIDYIKTTRNRINDRRDIFLELSEFEGNFALPDSIKTAYLLAGISDTRYCEANQKNTRQINVTKTLELIRFLDSHSVHTVFVSSASVFDGGKRTYHVDEIKQPRNFYGECKSEVEDVILKQLEGAGRGRMTFHAGSVLENGELKTAGGRVLCVVGLGDNVRVAQKHAYDAVDQIRFDGMQFRRDIGWREVAREAGE